MKVFLVALLATAASAATITDYGLGLSGSSISAGANAASSASGAYGGRTERRCTPYFDTVQDERCEAYTERTCITTQRESCREVPDQNCRALVSSKQIRQCFNVTEERCQLKEDVQFETIQVPFVVQKCVKVNERICDTVYETSSSQKDNLQCIQIENPNCQSIDKTINDVTCRTTTQFDCDQSGYGASSGSSGSSSGGHGAVDAYGNPVGGSSGYSSQSGYGQPEPSCRRKQETKCYKTPRTVSVQQCQPKREKVCERLPESVPFAQARQSCRNEEKKVCELEERLQPKQVKKYVYSTQCRPVPRSVCDNADRKQLVPSCVGTTRKECSFSPSESCQDEPKQHCYQVSRQVKRERCETVQVPAYPSPQPAYAPAQPEY